MMVSPDAKSIAVRCPNWVGDLIMATPVFECLRDNFPDTRIIALSRPYNVKILEGHPCIDTIIPCDDKSLGGIREAARSLAMYSPDFAILLPHSIRSWLPARLAGVPEIFGYSRGIRAYFVNGPHPEKIDGKYVPMPMLDYYLNLCRWMGMSVRDKPSPSFSITEELTREAHRLMEGYGIKEGEVVIGLNPGAKFGSSKCWPPEHFAALADLIEQRLGYKMLLLVGPGEDEIAAEIMKRTTSALINTGPDRIDLGLLKPVIDRCALLVTNDTGPRHYATALGKPVVVLMGPTDARYTQSNLEETVVLQMNLPCSPCHKKQCPEEHECMRGILPDEVMVAIEKLLGQTSQRTD